MCSKRKVSIDFKIRSTRSVRSRTESVPLTKTVEKSELPVSVVPHCAFPSAVPNYDEACFSGANIKRKRDNNEENWNSVRDKIAAVGLSLESPASFGCSMCNIYLENPIRCLDCHTFFSCCEECENMVHNRILHKPEIWQVKHYYIICYNIDSCMALHGV
jgi:hypothetical protein